MSVERASRRPLTEIECQQRKTDFIRELLSFQLEEVQRAEMTYDEIRKLLAQAEQTLTEMQQAQNGIK